MGVLFFGGLIVNKSNFDNSVLAEFDTLIDVDVGILRLIKNKYNNPKFFKDYIVTGEDDFFKALSLMRKEYNIIERVIEDQYKENSNSLLKEMYEKHYEEILNLSIKTSILPLMKMYTNCKAIAKTLIMCKNEIEKKYISNLKLGLATEIIPNYDINVKDYSAIFIKDITNLKIYTEGDKTVDGCYFYLSDYRFNYIDMEKDGEKYKILKPDYLALLPKTSFLFTVEPYTGYKLPLE